MSVCMNCSQHDSNDVDVIAVLIKIRMKTKPLINHYLNCMRWVSVCQDLYILGSLLYTLHVPKFNYYSTWGTLVTELLSAVILSLRKHAYVI